MERKLDVKLVGFTPDPVGLVYSLWHQSRCDDPILDPELVEVYYYKCPEEAPTNYKAAYNRFGPPDKLFTEVLSSNIPVGNCINFTFILENVSVAFREQLVRHQQRDNEKGEMQTVSYWSQTSRARDIDHFAEQDMFYIPDPKHSTSNLTENSIKYYKECMNAIQGMYMALKNFYGWHQDDARLITPIGYTHRISFSVSLPRLIEIFKTRTCWVAQSSLWHPVLALMIEELCNKVSPLFSTISDPPCYKRGKFNSCPVISDNEQRVLGKDPSPPCPIYAYENTCDILRFHKEERIPSDYKKQWDVPISKLLGAFSGFWRSEITEHANKFLRKSS